MEQERYEQLIEEMHREFPRFRMVRKDASRFQKAIHYGLVALTFGGMKAFLTSYHTTIGQTIYVAADWDERSANSRYIVLRHERVHLRQFRRYTPVGMALLYLFVPLPLGLAYYRAKFEKEAYAETVRTAAQIYGLERVRDKAFRKHIVSHFLDASYGWMWPFRTGVETWYDEVLRSIETSSETT